MIWNGMYTREISSDSEIFKDWLCVISEWWFVPQRHL